MLGVAGGRADHLNSKTMFLRIAVLITIVLWLPDVWLLTRQQPPLAVGVLMAMHLAIALVTYNLLVHVAPMWTRVEATDRERTVKRAWRPRRCGRGRGTRRDQPFHIVRTDPRIVDHHGDRRWGRIHSWRRGPGPRTIGRPDELIPIRGRFSILRTQVWAPLSSSGPSVLVVVSRHASRTTRIGAAVGGSGSPSAPVAACWTFTIQPVFCACVDVPGNDCRRDWLPRPNDAKPLEPQALT